jgi:hypothetical protein
MRLSPENEFITGILRSYLGHQNSRLGDGHIWDFLNWNKVISVARAQDLFPLFYHVVSHHELLGKIPSPQREEIEEGFLANTASTLLYESLLKEILLSFGQAGIPFIILKGPSMALEFYRPIEMRPYKDLDLLTKGEDFERAKGVLLSLEFKVDDPVREGVRRKYFNSIGFCRPGVSEVHLDLHWETLMVSWNQRPFLSDTKVWENIRWLECSDMEIPVLQPQMLILYLCLHLALHHQFGKLLTLCDLDLIIQKFGKKVDWDEIIWQSRGMMIRKPVYYSLELAASLLKSDIPESVLVTLRQKRIEERLLPLHYLVFRSKRLYTNMERLIKFVLIDDLQGKAQSFITFWKQR